jgi:threonine aldolase
MDPDDIARHILKRDLHRPGTRLLCVENTHNRAGGAVIPVAMLNAYREVADRHGIAMHLDGARAFNAAVALGVDIRAITDPFDTVSICLSKGLRSPVGSLLCGPQTLIDEAKFWRKRLGGGMRQSGLLAACGIVSLTQMVDRLAEDHRRARTIAEALANLPGIHTDPATTETNIVMVYTDRPAEQWQADLQAQEIWCFPVAPHRLRLVFHADITDDHLEQAITAFQKITSTT